MQSYSFLTSKIFLTLVELRNDIEAAIMALTCCEKKNIKLLKFIKFKIYHHHHSKFAEISYEEIKNYIFIFFKSMTINNKKNSVSFDRNMM